MVSGLLADAVLVAHLSFIVFAILGAALAFRWPWVAAAHLPVLAWAVWVEVANRLCPLTTLENALRRQAGEAGYADSFVHHYLMPVVYPPGLSEAGQVGLGVALLAWNVLLYGLLIARHRNAHPEWRERWNHNLHYHPLVLAAAPAACARALDVGCGEGVLTRELRAVADEVVGIDLDPGCVDAARARGGAGIAYVQGDFLAHPFEPESFDLVASVAALHHMDAEAALARMAGLLRPGGVLVVVALARSRGALDLACDGAGAVATRFHRYVLGRRYWEHDAPKLWPPPLGYGELRHSAGRVLPGVVYRRHVLWRCSLRWTRPED